MRLIDANELMEHTWRDKLDSRELIAKMIEEAPTIKEIPTKIPIEIFEKLISQEPQQKTGHWILYDHGLDAKYYQCSICKGFDKGEKGNYCKWCGTKMDEP